MQDLVKRLKDELAATTRKAAVLEAAILALEDRPQPAAPAKRGFRLQRSEPDAAPAAARKKPGRKPGSKSPGFGRTLGPLGEALLATARKIPQPFTVEALRTRTQQDYPELNVKVSGTAKVIRNLAR